MTIPLKPSNHAASKSRSPGDWWRRYYRYYYVRLVRLRSTPHSMARGLAIGVFAGMFPAFGFQIMMALGLAIILRGNKLLAALGTWISNPLTYVPIFWCNLQIGQWLLGREMNPLPIDRSSPEEFLSLGQDLLTALLLGCSVVGLIVAVVIYTIGVLIFQRLSSHRKSR